MNEEKTIFEKIIEGEIPSAKVYEDENTFAFLDINPSTPGHTLVVPKKPYKNIYEMPENNLSYLMNSVKKVSSVLKEALSADGIKIMMNNDPVAGQEVFHAHVHIIPRFKNDNWPKKYKYKEGEVEDILEKLGLR